MVTGLKLRRQLRAGEFEGLENSFADVRLGLGDWDYTEYSRLIVGLRLSLFTQLSLLHLRELDDIEQSRSITAVSLAVRVIIAILPKFRRK